MTSIDRETLYAIQQNMTIRQLERHFKLTRNGLRARIEKLRQQGYDIQTVYTTRGWAYRVEPFDKTK